MSTGPTQPPATGRERVAAPRRNGHRESYGATVSQEVAEQTAVGEVMVRSLIRSQLRLAIVVSAGFAASLLLCWGAVRWVPAIAESRLAGIPLPWLVLGVGVYPIIGACAWLYVRAAAKNESAYRDLVDEK
ncbi:hypothetical protein SAMN04489740_1833 [Arthrobacter alpinus]|uniref:Uncharacterized protein n=1 Tax=Arthrobacter alpinus TaxID=656366 RepID=A0A0U3RHD9_9MICC|nr:hypothetical protein [Arthrobacter alpinus]ALV44721.1 hypothetical protein MB46_03525 [Arthrobacter alpinus]SEE58544.1 hypothetical protein SAMN04489740_1833 [Arthrobacter alpinus]